MKDILVLLVCVFFYRIAVKKLVTDFNDIYGDAIDDFFDGYNSNDILGIEEDNTANEDTIELVNGR